MGFVATTYPGGAGKWKKEYSKYFKEAEVVLIPDLDRPGIEGAHKIATGLNGTVKSMSWLHLPGLDEVKPKHGKDFLTGLNYRIRHLKNLQNWWTTHRTGSRWNLKVPIKPPNTEVVISGFQIMRCIINLHPKSLRAVTWNQRMQFGYAPG